MCQIAAAERYHRERVQSIVEGLTGGMVCYGEPR
jgi:hypothetical protein